VTRLRADGHEAVPLVRGEPATGEIGWDPRAGRLDRRALAGIDAVVNLAGAGIGDRRWSDEYRRIVMESRTGGTRLLAETIAELDDGPRVLLSGSAVGFYGDRGDEELDESSAPGSGFLAEVAQAWEASTAPAEQAGARVVHLRTGIVLAGHGGALAKLLPLFRLGLGGRFGSGRQWMSWIALEDEVGAIVHLLQRELAGPVNLTAPEPVRNAELASTLGRVLHRPAVLPVPGFGPKLVLGAERAEALLLEGQRVRPARLLADGYEFAHPTLEGALHAVLQKT
jgi:uncharacterized protein (TIGR01777 family)